MRNMCISTANYDVENPSNSINIITELYFNTYLGTLIYFRSYFPFVIIPFERHDLEQPEKGVNFYPNNT
jgi:hypothetical protein